MIGSGGGPSWVASRLRTPASASSSGRNGSITTVPALRNGCLAASSAVSTSTWRTTIAVREHGNSGRPHVPMEAGTDWQPVSTPTSPPRSQRQFPPTRAPRGRYFAIAMVFARELPTSCVSADGNLVRA